MKRVTGIGGIVFKAKNPKKFVARYEKHLGIPFGRKVYPDFILMLVLVSSYLVINKKM